MTGKTKTKAKVILTVAVISFALTAFTVSLISSQEDLKAKYSFKDFESAKECSLCHPGIYEQWTQAMMSQAYTHHWDEIEYFDLAVAHAKVKPELEEVADGCNGCHTPIAFMSGPFPPPRPSEKSMANESVSCEVCHLIQSAQTDPPHNFSYLIKPGITKYAGRTPTEESPTHEIATNEFFRTTEFCANCHNEKSPAGVWVKSTQMEWKEGPYSKEGVRCQDCHMPSGGPFMTSLMTEPYNDSRLHLFQGAYNAGKVRGTIELSIQPDKREAEEYTISGDYLAYQDMGVPLRLNDFKGVQRDGIPAGNRIFRMPYFDPEGRMTIMQWNTARLGVDYRIGPRETKVETFTFSLPSDAATGEMKVRAVMNYQLLVKPVAEFLKVPAEESEIKIVNEHSTTVLILP